MQRPIITFRLDEPYNYPGEDEARFGKGEEFELPGVVNGIGLESAASPPRAAEAARGKTHFPPQPPPRPIKTTEWITAVAMTVLSLAAAYYAVRSNGFNRSQYQLAASSTQAALAAVQETTRTDQQAWVGLTLPVAYPLSRDGGGFAIKLRNFGKLLPSTSALRITS